jgi:hypothetical protein
MCILATSMNNINNAVEKILHVMLGDDKIIDNNNDDKTVDNKIIGNNNDDKTVDDKIIDNNDDYLLTNDFEDIDNSSDDSSDDSSDVSSVIIDDVEHMEKIIKIAYANITKSDIKSGTNISCDAMCKYIVIYIECFNDKIFMLNLRDNPHKIFSCHNDDKKKLLIQNWTDTHVSEMHDRIYTITTNLEQDNVISLVCPRIICNLRNFDTLPYCKKVETYILFTSGLIERFKFFC